MLVRRHEKLTETRTMNFNSGRPSSSLYFLGHTASSKLIHLDPHFPQPVVPFPPITEGGEQRGYTKDDFKTYHCDKLRKVNLGEVDPSVLVGFLVKRDAEVKDGEEKGLGWDRFCRVWGEVCWGSILIRSWGVVSLPLLLFNVSNAFFLPSVLDLMNNCVPPSSPPLSPSDVKKVIKINHTPLRHRGNYTLIRRR